MFFRSSFLFLSIAALLACSDGPSGQVVARVDGEKILQSEFDLEFGKAARELDPTLLADPTAALTLKKEVLSKMIQQKILLNEAARKGLTISPKEWDERKNRLKSGYTDQEFEETLRKNGEALKQWEQDQRQNLVVGKLIDQVLGERRPTEKEAREEFRKHSPLYSEPERSHCRQIAAGSKEKAEKILDLLKKGENFAVLAEKYSESPDRDKGGDLGFVARGELPPIMDEACFRFRPGETSGVLQSLYGFHIFRVIERKPARSLSFEEALPKIEKQWREIHREEILKPWLEQLERSAKIQIDDPLLQERD